MLQGPRAPGMEGLRALGAAARMRIELCLNAVAPGCAFEGPLPAFTTPSQGKAERSVSHGRLLE